ncbi:MAG: phosphonate metabolism protein/1,5-bisphosphokinase (PRPP-forming) PhnN [Hyphomicrobiaceae bacterium]|nr:phosphonate metabolism protein/1,5-bisphosphokinase (PRPP-forming) PhnN [Hyphomicrobiaceae bacterium]
MVGPSGVGKDSLLAGARARLDGDPRFVFPARCITRNADAGGEQHIAMTPAEFEAARAAGQFLLSWYSHGLGYGIARTAAEDLARNSIVVVNVSRTVIGWAEELVDKVVVLHVTAEPAELARRIALRGREDAADIAARLAREVTVTTRSAAIVEIANNGALDAAVERFTAALLGLAAARSESAR